MLFGPIKEEAEATPEINDIDLVAGTVDPETEEGMEALAREVESSMTTAALEAMSLFDGGEEAQKAFIESAECESLCEARKLSKRTFVRLNKNDDLKRRSHLASIVLAKNANDPLFKKLALNRVKERKLRALIFKKYANKAKIVAKKSQKQHLKNSKPFLPIKFN